MYQQRGHICPRCGFPITIGQRFCSNCASALDPASIAQYQASKQDRIEARRRRMLGFGILMPILACLACGIWWTLISAPSQNSSGSSNVGIARAANPTATKIASSKPASILPQATAVTPLPQNTTLPADTATPLPPTSTPVPSVAIGGTVTLGNWLISLARLEKRDCLAGNAGQILGPYYLVWIDARNNSQDTKTLNQDIDLQPINAQGADGTILGESGLDSPDKWLTVEGRQLLATPAAPGDVVHPMLVVDSVGGAPLRLVVTNRADNSSRMFDLTTGDNPSPLSSGACIPTATPSPTKTAIPTRTPDPSVLVLGTKRIKLNSVYTTNGSGFMKASAGKKFVIIDLTIQNISAKPIQVSTLLECSLKDANGRSYDLNLSAQVAAQDQLGSDPGGTLQPGEKNTGPVGFEVPANLNSFEFHFDNVFDDEHATWSFKLK